MRYLLSILFLGYFSIVGNVSVNASTEQVACTREYMPVCGYVSVQCIKEPCTSMKKTFSNTCLAKAANATGITSGECSSVTESNPAIIVGGDRDSHGCIGSAGYSWSITENKCIRPWESPKIHPRVAIQNGTWNIDSLNGVHIASSGSLVFGKKKFVAKLCNTITGEYGITSTSLIVRKAISTMMYCDSDIMSVENVWNFTRAKFTLNENYLTVTTKKGDVIVWKKQQ